MTDTAPTSTPQTTDLAALHAKVDALSQQMAFVVQQLEDARRQREVWSDLGRDLAPVLDSMYLQAVEQLEDLSPHVQMEDIFRLARRFLRDVRLLHDTLQNLEMLNDLVRDVSPVAHDAFLLAVHKLDEMEKKGFFALLRELQRLLEAVLATFSPEDLQALTDSLVPLVQTLKTWARPEKVRQIQQMLDALSQEQTQVPSMWALARQMHDPDVRRGLAVSLRLLQILGRLTGPNGSSPTS